MKLFPTRLFDEYLMSTIFYFGALFRKENLEDVEDEVMDMLNQEEHKRKVEAAKYDVERCLREMARNYSRILMNHSVDLSQKPLKEEVFYETIYEFTTKLLFILFDGKYYPRVEAEIGRLYRTKYFNLEERRYQEKKAMPTLRQLYVRRYHGTDDVPEVNLVMNRKQAVHELPSKAGAVKKTKIHNKHKSSIHDAVRTQSPLIGMLYTTNRNKKKGKASLPKKRMTTSSSSSGGLKNKTLNGRGKDRFRWKGKNQYGKMSHHSSIGSLGTLSESEGSESQMLDIETGEETTTTTTTTMITSDSNDQGQFDEQEDELGELGKAYDAYKELEIKDTVYLPFKDIFEQTSYFFLEKPERKRKLGSSTGSPRTSSRVGPASPRVAVSPMTIMRE
eukprot:TRINITY_DN2219_c1_g1_i2.p1 TRINITY_DN2219_c1_g1~~TRINITY_DN2219_c1_g1_i2.p1  ORF type:complete len:390 (-),score=136.80 TRINITY_DN2219_c1_g1_i2:136-1305(-)